MTRNTRSLRGACDHLYLPKRCYPSMLAATTLTYIAGAAVLIVKIPKREEFKRQEPKKIDIK